MHSQIARRLAKPRPPDNMRLFSFFRFRYVSAYHGSQDYTGLHILQEKSTHYFTTELERLKLSQDLTDEELADEIGISRRMLYLMRTGKAPVSKKSWYKLEQAEKRAGLFQDLENNVVKESNVRKHNVGSKTCGPQPRAPCWQKELLTIRSELLNLTVKVERVLEEMSHTDED